MKKKNQTFSWKRFVFRIFQSLLIIIPAIFLMTFVVQRLVYFPPIGLGSSPEKLGQYGDYFGGIVGGITSIATLGVTIYLALLLQRIEKENNESTIEAQRRVALMQMKFQEYTLYSNDCENGLDKISLMHRDQEEARQGCLLIEIRSRRLMTIFPELRTTLSAEFDTLFETLGKAMVMSVSFTSRTDEYGSNIRIGPSINDVAASLSQVSGAYSELLLKLGEWTRD